MDTESKENYDAQIKSLIDHLEEADAIVVGAASGLSAAAGFRHYYERDEDFVKNFSDFEKKYGYHNTFDGAYYPYASDEERWAFVARLITTILNAPTGEPYYDMYELLKDKPIHIITTNQDTQLERVFPPEKISAIQGDWRYLQCSRCCQDKLYDAVEPIEKLSEAIDSNLEVPTELIPRCPNCGALLDTWVRSPIFLQGEKYAEEYEKANKFIEENKDKKILFLELGVGRMTPMFIQQPFWNLTYALPNAYYITINPRDAILPYELRNKGMAIHEDIAKVFKDAVELTREENEQGIEDEQN